MQAEKRGRLTNTYLLKRVHSLVANYTLLLCADEHIRESTALLTLHIDNKNRGIWHKFAVYCSISEIYLGTRHALEKLRYLMSI
jgi:hypothetical protein